MIETQGDLWKWQQEAPHGQVRWVVIPTNLEVKKDGAAVMGAGLAKQAAERYKSLPHYYGGRMKDTANGFLVVAGTAKVICLPTKARWKDRSVFALIELGLHSLAEWKQTRPDDLVGLPKLGCGLGGLKWEEVKPLMERYLVGDEWVVFV